MHLVDTGFLDAELLVTSRRDYGVELLDPTRKDQRWQARAGEGFRVEHFAVEFKRRTATCPEGHETEVFGQDQLHWPIAENRPISPTG